MPSRKRLRLVEKGGVEAFEIRLVRWFNKDGESVVSVDVTTPDGTGAPDVVEALGAIDYAKSLIISTLEVKE